VTAEPRKTEALSGYFAEGRGYLLAVPGILHKKRLVILLVFVVIVFLLLLVRIGYWTFYKGEWLQEKAGSQWTQDVAVAAQRGSIIDRNGNILAQSASADTVVLRPKQIKEPDKVADSLSVILEMDRQTVYEKATDDTKTEIWLKRQITREQSEEIQSLKLDGVAFTTDVKRYYPNKELLCQVIGITSADGEGLSGLEKQYENDLSGKTGRMIAETDKKGRELADGYEFYMQREDGYNVVLSVDAVIQGFLEKACEETYEANGAKSVQGIVMDPNTGEILAMANIPGFDLNDPPRNDAEALQELSQNKVTSDVFEPGSVFGIVTAAAALDAGAVSQDTAYDCTGYTVVDGQRIECWKAAGHGQENLPAALQESCSPYFAQMALDMGADVFYQYIHNFGIGQKSGIDFLAEQPGTVVDQKYLQDYDLARIGTGGDIGVTSLQLASAVSAAVNGGTLYQPRLVTALTDADGNVVQQFDPQATGQAVSAQTSGQIKQMLRSVVEAGTGKNAQIPGYTVGGMGGTAQKYDESGTALEGKMVSTFVAFAPADDPKYVVLILVDDPGVDVKYGSVVAAPYVKDVLAQVLQYGNIPPADMEKTTETVTVPDLSGLDAETAKAQIEALGLGCVIDGSGTVTGQLPSPGETIAKGTAVTLYTEGTLAGGTPESADMAQVPDVTGMDVTEARDALEAAGFVIDIRSSGRAVRQSPGAGGYAQKGSMVTVYFALDLGGSPQEEE